MLSAGWVWAQQPKITLKWTEVPSGWEVSNHYVSHSVEEREGFTRTFASVTYRFLEQIFEDEEAFRRYYYEQESEDGKSNLFIRHLQRQDGVDEKEAEDPLVAPDEIPWALIYERSGYQSMERLTVDGYEALLLRGGNSYASRPLTYLSMAITVENQTVLLIGSCESSHCSDLIRLMQTVQIKVAGDEDPERVMIAITRAVLDTTAHAVRVTGTYKSKSAITSASILRVDGGAAIQGHVTYGNGRFTASCDFAANVGNTFRIVFDNAAQKSAEQNVSFSASGTLIRNITTNAEGNTQVDVPIIPGLGQTGSVPGPQTIIQGVIGVLGPGIIGILGGLLGGWWGGIGSVPPPVVPKPPINPPPKSPVTPPRKTAPEKPKTAKPKQPPKKPELSSEEKARQAAAEKAKKRAEAKARAEKLLADQQKAHADLNSWTKTVIGTVSNAGQDIQQGYHDVKGIVIPVVNTVKTEVKSAVQDVVKDPSILVTTATGTISDVAQGAKDLAEVGKDLVTHPVEIGWETVKGTAADAKTLIHETYGKAFMAMVRDPAKFKDFIYNASGLEDLNKATDPNLSLVQRSGHYGLAVYKTILNVMGGAGVKQAGWTAVKAAGIRGLTSTVQYGAARNAPVFHELYQQVEAMSKAGEKHIGVSLTQTQKLKITTGLFLEWYKRRYPSS